MNISSNLMRDRHKLMLWLCASVTIAMGCVILYTLFHDRTFRRTPVDGIVTLAVPALIAWLGGLFLPTRLLRVSLLSILTGLCVWIIGLQGVMAVVLMSLVSLILGDWCLRLAKQDDEDPDLYRSILATTLGLAVMGLALTFISHFPVTNPGSAAITFLTVIAFGWRVLRKYATLFTAWLSSNESVSAANWLCAGLVAGALLINVGYAALPGLSGDTMAMHLYIASYMKAYGDWSYDFHQVTFALMPILADLLDGPLYMLSDLAGAQLLNVVCAGLTAGLIYSVSRARIGATNAMLCVTAWLMLTLVLGESGSLHVELVQTLFLFASFVYLIEFEGESPHPYSVAAISGLLFSAAVATKLPSWILCPFLLLAVFIPLGQRYGYRWAARTAVAAILLVVTIGGSPYWYSLVVSGNPVFFFYNAIFKSPYFRAENALDTHWVGHYNWHLPFLATFHTQVVSDVGPGGAGFQWFLFLPAAFIFAAFKGAHKARWYGLAGLGFAALVLLPEQYLRYLIPAFPFLSLFIAEGAAHSYWLTQATYKTGMALVVILNTLALHGVDFRLQDFPLNEVFSRESRAELEARIVPASILNRIIDAMAGTQVHFHDYPLMPTYAASGKSADTVTGPASVTSALTFPPQFRPPNVLYFAKRSGGGLEGTAYYRGFYSESLKDYTGGKPATEDDVMAFVRANKVDYVIVDLSAKKRRRGNQATANAFLAHHARLIAQAKHMLLYSVDRDVLYTRDVIANPELQDDAAQWTLVSGVKPKYQQGMGLVLESRTSIKQPLNVSQFDEAQEFLFHAEATCLAASGSVEISITWRLKSGETTRVPARYPCTSAGPLTMDNVMVAPSDTVRGVATITVVGNGRVALSRADVQD